MKATKRSVALAAGFAATLGLTAATPATADDRDLLRTSTATPYLFIILDTSGSMHWAPPCTQEQLDADPSECNFLCPEGDCVAPLNGDDEASKLFQAKEVLYKVIDGSDDVNFGFATYNQDDLRLRAKHWMYEADGGGPNISGFGAFPPDGAQEVFGLLWDCDTGTGDNNIGCYPDQPADLNSTWERTRVQRLPKGGLDFDSDRTFYVRSSGTTYQIRYRPVSGTLGDSSISVAVRRRTCDNSSCSDTSNSQSVTVTFDLVSDFNSWDFQATRSAPQQGYFSQGEAADSPAGDTCNGWDSNSDDEDDEFSNYSIRWPTVEHPDHSPELDSGDVVPLNWENDNKQTILERVAPNLALGETTPDYRTARYFEDVPASGNNHLRLRDARARPLIAFGSTPVVASMEAFHEWFEDWRSVAAENDPDWGCRRVFLLVLTDGDETCGGEDRAGSVATALKDEQGVKTFVVAFGVAESSGNVLEEIADGAGTEVIYPQNRAELEEALRGLLDEIAEESRSFASAAVPSVQAQVTDKIYLTNFTPLNDSSVWDGHLDAYLKPLPLTEDNLPDRDKACGGSVESSCHGWDAGEILLTQAPTAEEVAADTFRLGNSPTDRRVLYPLDSLTAAVPRTLRLFSPPDSEQTSLWLDLLTGMGISFDPLDLGPAQDDATDVIRFTLRQKEDTIDVGTGTEDITFVLGDVFHSTPVIQTTPERFRYFAADLYGNGRSCVDPVEPSRGYRCFFNRHRFRRKLVLVGSNDGQLHAFEAGRFTGTVDADNQVQGEFDDGTGNEVFSIIPRSLLPTVREQAADGGHDWGVDNTMVLDDFFIDPAHAGIPTEAEREWRTVGIVGLREGGAAYLAVDLTQPDVFQDAPLAEGIFLPDSGGDYVPSCLKNYTAADCGPLPFPSVLWEFTGGEVADEDENSFSDLGETWSIPNTGRIRVIEDGEIVDKFVAVFGGGMDPNNADAAGDWLYMVDVETGKAIYKRQLLGSAPSEPAAVDTDQDGYLDTIYIGTTAGWLFKVDISEAAELQDLTILGTDVRRIDPTAWVPFEIFDTGGRPIFYPPAVIYVARLGRYALGFGTGDREDLWSVTGQAGRFYVILDNGFALGDEFLPLDETAFEPIPAVGAEDAGRNFLLDPREGFRPGWFITLGTEERVITKTFSLSGITIFTSYIPELVTREPTEPTEPGEEEVLPICAKTGQSRIFVVYTDSANAVLTRNDEKTRFWLVSEFVTDPFTERSATKNPPSTGGPHSDELTDELRAVMETLEGLFPDDCQFGNFTMNMKTIRSDTGVVFIAPVPICIIEKNWKEF